MHHVISPRRAQGPRRLLVRSCAAVLLLLLMMACASHGGDATSVALVPQPPGDLRSTEWKLVAADDWHAVQQARALTVKFGDGTASGRGPCNTFHMKFTFGGDDGEDVTTGPIASTRIACPPRVNLVEQRFLRDLEGVDTAAKQAQRLVLTGPDDVWLAFERIDDD
jgi:heat shock protein HslJ